MYIETENHNARASAAMKDLIEASLRVCQYMLRGGRYAGDVDDVIDCVAVAVCCYFWEIVDGGFPHGVILLEADNISPASGGSSEEEILDDELALATEHLYMAYRDAYADVEGRQAVSILSAVADCTSRMLAQTLTLLMTGEHGGAGCPPTMAGA